MKKQLPVSTAPVTPRILPRVRPQMLSGSTTKVRTQHGTLYVTVNRDENDQLFEVFATIGKAGGCWSGAMEALTRMISLALRSNLAVTEIIDQLQGITCCPFHDAGVETRSLADAIAKVLKGDIK